MDVSNLISHDAPQEIRRQQHNVPPLQDQQRFHPYPTRHAILTNGQSQYEQSFSSAPTIQTPNHNSHGAGAQFEPSPPSPTPKNVTFELLVEGTTNLRARLPMRVQIFPHDTTDSIITTVKNFYGLYEGATTGVSFEDERGNTLIARFENFRNSMVVYVRVISDYSRHSPHAQYAHNSASPLSPHRFASLDEPVQMLPPQPAQALGYAHPLSRPASRVAGKRSPSPRNGRIRRSASAQKARSQLGAKSRETSVHGNVDDINSDIINGYSSSSDNGAGSATSSRKARSELVSAEISVDNIVEGGRRKRAKFESSVCLFAAATQQILTRVMQELPLFVPPQVPASNSISSISPQRRSNGQEDPSPFAKPAQRPFVTLQPLQSPQSYDSLQRANFTNNVLYTPPPSAQHSHRLRERANIPNVSTRTSSGAITRGQGFGILPTPDPTIASCISDEDVALQLMRLGEASNISHGRTSTSTLDDAFSGRADNASSVTSESSDESDNTEQPQLPLPIPLIQPNAETSSVIHLDSVKRHQKNLSEGPRSFDTTESSADEVDRGYVFDGKKEEILNIDADFGKEQSRPTAKSSMSGSKLILAAPKSRSNGIKKTSKPMKPRSASIPKKNRTPSLSTGFKTPLSPASLAPQSRKTSSASTLNFQHQLGADEEDLSSKPRCQRCRKSKKGCDRQRPCQRCQDAGIGAEGCISEDEGNGRKGRFGRHMGVSVKKEHQGITTATELQPHGDTPNGVAISSEKSKKRKR